MRGRPWAYDVNHARDVVYGYVEARACMGSCSVRWPGDDRLPGAACIAAFGVNDAGLVVGTYSFDAATCRGFTCQNGAFVSRLDVSDAVDTLPQGVNNAGPVVGAYSDDSGVGRGFLFDRGRCTPVDAGDPAATGAAALDINGAEQIVGFHTVGTTRARGYLLTGGVFEPM